jgi:hypothetical protein
MEVVDARGRQGLLPAAAGGFHGGRRLAALFAQVIDHAQRIAAPGGRRKL